MSTSLRENISAPQTENSPRVRPVDVVFLATGPCLLFLALFLRWASGYRIPGAETICLFRDVAILAQFGFALTACLCALLNHHVPRKLRAVQLVVAWSSLVIPSVLGWYGKIEQLGVAQVESEIGRRRLEDSLVQLWKRKLTERATQQQAASVPPDQWPPEIKRLRPRWIAVHSNRVEIQFGSGFDHYGYYFEYDGGNSLPDTTGSNGNYDPEMIERVDGSKFRLFR